MKKEVVEELLEEQAAELQRGRDPTAELQATFKAEPAVVKDLLGLGQRLKRALPQVEPASTYVSDLKTRLMERFPQAVNARAMAARARERRLLATVAVVGAVAYFAQIIALGIRWFTSVFGLARLVRATRKANPAERGPEQPG